MPKKLKKLKNIDSELPLLAEGSNVTAIIIGIEDYQPRPNGQIPSVAHARDDAEAFSAVLDDMFPGSDIHRIELLDSLATRMSVEDGVKEAIHATGPDDLLVFYYAGHGFHNGVSNMITIWDSNGHNLAGTCLNVRDLLFDPIEQSACRKSLTFIDACAEDLDSKFSSRNVISDMSEKEFRSFVKLDQFAGVFLSCKPGQKSFSHAALGHGVWSYHLVQALKGDAPDAIDAHSLITDTSLRDYLATSVRRYVTKKMSTASHQTPIAQVTAANRFAICLISKPSLPPVPESDFTSLSFNPDHKFFSHTETRDYDRLPGFSKTKGHFVPSNVNASGTGFARDLLDDEITEEIQNLYDITKQKLQLRRDDIETGDATLDTEFFRFWIDVQQKPDDPSEIQIVRCLVVRDGSEETLEEIDEIFGNIFDRYVCTIEGRGPDFDTVVRRLEDAEQEHGGKLVESEKRQLVTYFMPGSGRLEFDLANGSVSICMDKKGSYLDVLQLAKTISIGTPQKPVAYLMDSSKNT